MILSGKMKKNSEEAPEEKIFYLSLISAPRSGNSNNLKKGSPRMGSERFGQIEDFGKDRVVLYRRQEQREDLWSNHDRR